MDWQQILNSDSSHEQICKAFLASQINEYVSFDEWKNISDMVLDWLFSYIILHHKEKPILDVGILSGQAMQLMKFAQQEITKENFIHTFYKIFYEHGFIYALNYPKFNNLQYKTEHKEMNKIFTNIYQSGYWRHGSGFGSIPEQTSAYRQLLQNIIYSNRIRSVLDYGCGDWQSSQLIPWKKLVHQYIGVDLVQDVINNNQAKYGSSTVKFEVVDEQWMPSSVDLIICKDVFHHLPNYKVYNLMKLFLQHAKYVLITTDAYTQPIKNGDCYFGGYRPLNLLDEPFNFNGTVVYQSTDGLESHIKYIQGNEIQDTIVKQTILFRKV